jgi:signal transduction histidine kinase
VVAIGSREEWAARGADVAALAERSGIEAAVFVPVRLGERPLGVLALHVAIARTFSEDERAFLATFAGQCAQALERARLFEAERRAREELARVLAQAPVAIALVRGATHVVQMANARFAAIVGRGEVVGRPARDVFPALDAHGFGARLDAAYATGQPYVADEAPLPAEDADRAVRFLSFVFQPVVDAAGAVDGVAIVAIDVTAQVRARHAEEELRRAAEAANLSKTQFLASMSHELRTPLNAIGGYAELLELGIHGPVTDEQRAALERIQRSQQHLLGIINDILNFSRIEAGQVTYDIAEFAVAEAVHAVTPMITPQALAKHIELDTEGCAIPERALGDMAKVEQILLNLLSNAVKFTASGGRISIDCRVQGGKVRIAVTDTGVGIPADQLEAVFAPFMQVGRGLASPKEGTGLGLAISRDLARAMGGDLTVKSTPGVGSTFTLSLPRSTGAR